MRTAKAWWKSKTLWLNVPVGVAAMLTALLDWTQTLPAGTLPEGWETWLVGALAAVNAVLRLVTREAVALVDRTGPES